jgi:hypothetical protein
VVCTCPLTTGAHLTARRWGKHVGETERRVGWGGDGDGAGRMDKLGIQAPER